MEAKATLIGKKRVGFLNKEIKFNFRNLFKSISEGAVAYFTSATPELIKSGISLVDVIELKNKPEALVYSLIVKSFQQSVVEVINENINKLNPEFLTITNFQEYREYQNLIVEIEDTIESKSLVVGINFFDDPTQINILEPLIVVVKKWLVVFGFTDLEATYTSNKIKPYFIFALNDNWRKNSDEYQIIFDKIITPFSKITKSELDWKSYHSYLIKQSEESVFDEHFGLKDIFVPLYGYYEKNKKENESTECERHVVDVIDFLNTWIDNTKKTDDAIKVISGGPGSGKSTLAKMYAALIANKNNIKVLYIPLQHLNVKEDLTLSLGEYLQEANFFSQNPLDEIHKLSSQLLLIFDGLDELSKQGKIGYEIAKEFLFEIERKTSIINQSKIKLLVLLTGREISIQNNSSAFRRPNQVLNLLPYFNSDGRVYIDKNNYSEIDLRDMWWKKYGELKGLKYNGFPDELKNPNLDEITAQPLLNYLVALTYERNIIKFNSKTNLNEIFSDLIKAVFDRQYEKKQHKSITELNITEAIFFRILEEIAISAWHSGDARITTIGDINKHFEENNLSVLFREFQIGVNSGISRLLTAFYFRQKGVDTNLDKTFEFTHKSFGEYLTSRRLINLLALIIKKINEREVNPDEGIDKKEALKKLLEMIGVMPIDIYLLSFLSKEIQLRPIDEVKNMQHTVISLIEHSLSNGIPVEQLSPRPNFEKELSYYRNTILAQFIFLKIISDYTMVKSKIKWPKKTTLVELIALLRPLKMPRLARHYDISGAREFTDSDDPSSLINSCFTNMIIEDCDLACSDLVYANFSNSTLKNVALAGSDLFGSRFTNSNINNVNFYRASLHGCNFDNAVFNQKDAVHHITIEQLTYVESFENAKGLDDKIVEQLKRSKAERIPFPNKKK